MNARNYDREMEKTAKDCAALGIRPRLMLHACCAPCSSSCLERLKDSFAVTVLFYNPNIEEEEYFKRKQELLRLIKETGWADFCDCDYDPAPFYLAAKGLEDCPEGGKRCAACFKLRLEKCAKTASEKGYDYFSTTLTLSPLKDADLINGIGFSLAENYGVKWLPCDFKKRNGYLRSLQLSKKYSLYRQNYCGCVFSRNDLKNKRGDVIIEKRDDI